MEWQDSEVIEEEEVVSEKKPLEGHSEPEEGEEVVDSPPQEVVSETEGVDSLEDIKKGKEKHYGIQ